uniref:Uncharacterized protein n=1 Tax=Opuntia streptacantha TaxID=393608 RepID=A0A7C9B1C1_OPUST
MNWRELGIENPNPDLISVVVLISMYIIRVISDLYCCSGLNCSRNLHLLNTILLILFKLGLFLHYLTAVICFWVSSNRELSWMETSWSTYSSSAFGICALTWVRLLCLSHHHCNLAVQSSKGCHVTSLSIQ